MALPLSLPYQASTSVSAEKVENVNDGGLRVLFLQAFQTQGRALYSGHFSGHFIRFHFLMSSLVRSQMTHSSLFSWQTEIQGFSMSLAIVQFLVELIRAKGSLRSKHGELIG